MKFQFKNIGVIESADIELKGLTILTGHNDVGKSFISRAIFSIIKTINQFLVEYEYEKVDRISERFSQILYYLRSKERTSIVYSSKLRGFFNNKTNEIVNYLIADEATPKPIGLYFDTLKLELISLLKENNYPVSEEVEKEVYSAIDSLYSSLIVKKTNEEILIEFLDNAINNEFRSQISFFEEDSYIGCFEGTQLLTEVKIHRNKISELKFLDSSIYKDSTLIETPVILQLSNFITTSLAFDDNPFTPRTYLLNKRAEFLGHIADLIQKIRKPGFDNELIDVYSNISSVINGSVSYNSDEDDFYFETGGLKIKPVNMATGIKSFGILQLLIESESINNQSVLIIDEPEVHLHPKWQKEYAELVVKLVAKGIPILISTHSPYMLKAFSIYAAKYKVEESLKYYVGEKGETGRVNYKDVSEDLEPIYNLLSEPMQDLFFES